MLVDLDADAALRALERPLPSASGPSSTAAGAPRSAIRDVLGSTLRAMKIGVIGLGYVGLPLAVAFARPATRWSASTSTSARRGARRRAARHRGHPVRAARRRSASACTPTTRYADLAKAEAVDHRRADAADAQPRAGPGAARSAPARSLAERAPARASSWSSSRRPTRARRASGSCPLLEESGLAAGRDFNVAFSPERVDPGRTDYTLRNTPKVVGGLTDACLRARGRALRRGLRRASCRSRRRRRPS